MGRFGNQVLEISQTIYTEELLLEKIAYMHNNPVRKGLVLDASRYKFSSANPIYETDIELVL